MTTAAEQAVAIAVATVKLRKEREQQGNAHANDPVGFIRERLGEGLWSKQREIAEAVRDHRHVAVHSAHDTGKSFIASRLAAWWLSTRPAGEAFVVTTAPTFAQVRAILWREIGRAQRKGNLPGRVNQTEWHINDEIVAYGRKPADYDQAAFQGIHARYVLVILDEACGIPKSLWDAVETITTNEHSRVLAIGNPDTPLSQFFKVCERESDWHVIHVDGLDSPNFTDEAVAEDMHELLLSPTWVEERRKEWGETSALFTSKVRGIFPKVPEGSVYGRELNLTQQWYGPLPEFKKLQGGVDIGGAKDGAHKTTAVIGGIVGRDDSSQMASENQLILFGHFEHDGPDAHVRLVEWMRAWDRKLGRRVQWRIDKSQSLGVSLLQDKLGEPFAQASDGGPGSVPIGVGLVRNRLASGGLLFSEELTHIPRFDDGTEMNGRPWFERMQNYRYPDDDDERRAAKLNPLKRDDDTPDATRYLVEAIDGTPVPPASPAILRRTLGGKRRTNKVV